MDTNQQSLISKIVRKGVLTPYEAILVQYLNNKHAKQIPELTNESNIYLIPKKINPLVSSFQLKDLLTFTTLQQCQEYDGYQWAANLLMSFDKGTAELAYKGIALLNELRYFHSEKVLNFIVKEHEDKKITGTLFDFKAYSHIHQQPMTFEEIVQSVAATFRMIIISIDNVLTLNYFLKGMIEVPQLHSLEGLKMFLAKETINAGEEPETQLNIAQLCYELLTDVVINANHAEFFQLVEIELKEFNRNVSADFQEETLIYVKKTLSETIGLVSPLSP